MGEIEIARCRDGRQLQTLPISTWGGIDFASTFRAADINFDGYLDLSVLIERAATFGSQAWWVYSPTAGKFVQNKLTRELRELRSNGYAIHPDRHQLVLQNMRASCPTLISRYRVYPNGLVNTHYEDAFQGDHSCRVTYYDLLDGKLKVTRVRRFHGLPG